MLTSHSDEISALVLDPGYSTTRAGFAGEDVPKAVIPTSYGKTASQPYIFGDNSIHTPASGIEILNPMAKDGTVEDWDTAMKLWEYAITSRLTNPKPRSPIRNGLNDTKDLSEEDAQAMEVESAENQENPLEENPLLMTEQAWNSTKNREKAIELVMEEWHCPAFWLARNPVLAAFASGKPSALVIDIGATTASVVPIHDGMVLRKGIQRSPLAGNWISNQLRILFSTTQPPITINPHYLVTSKTPVDAGSPAIATYRSFTQGTEPHPSFRRLQEERILTEFKESVVQVWNNPGRLLAHSPAGLPNEDIARAAPGRPFEFPDGFNQVFGVERYRVVEGMFDPKAALLGEGQASAPNTKETLTQCIQSSLSQVDVDIRPHLLSNVVVTGASSLTQGFTDRLNIELGNLYPGPRVRINAPGNVYERRFASWIGGSILASLGTFHQVISCSVS